ncbi:MAG: hypothetical protein WD672_07055 [Woeseia sp.]
MADRFEKYNQAAYLDLLKEFRSRETVRARRNVGVLSFALCMTYVFDVPARDLKLGAIQIPEGKEPLAYMVALVLLSYWLVLFVVHLLNDRATRRETFTVASSLAVDARKERAKLDEAADKNTRKDIRKGRQYILVSRWLDGFNAQAKRTRLARWTAAIGQTLSWLPTTLIAIGGLLVCLRGLGFLGASG